MTRGAFFWFYCPLTFPRRLYTLLLFGAGISGTALLVFDGFSFLDGCCKPFFSLFFTHLITPLIHPLVLPSNYSNRNLSHSREILSEDKVLTAKVLLFTYMRGGSTVFSELFNMNNSPNVFWYEPLDAFYSYYFGLGVFNLPISILYGRNFQQRKPTNHEYEVFTRYFQNLFDCNVSRLPFETLSHSFFIGKAAAFRGIFKCLPQNRSEIDDLLRCNNRLVPYCVNSKDGVIHDGKIRRMGKTCHQVSRLVRGATKTKPHPRNKTIFPNSSEFSLAAHRKLTEQEYEILRQHHSCLNRKRFFVRNCVEPVVKRACAAKPSIVSAKVLRASMADMETLIQRIPDLRIIYFVRDPRATASSRVRGVTQLMYSTTDFNASTEAKALCMRMQDDIDAKRKLEALYPGAILTVRYEDFVKDTHRTVDAVYNYVGRPPPDNIYSHLNTLMHADNDNGIYGVHRADAEKLIDRWRTRSTPAEIDKMNKFCLSVLKEFQYEI